MKKLELPPLLLYYRQLVNRSNMWHDQLMRRLAESSVITVSPKPLRTRFLLALTLVGLASGIRFVLDEIFGVTSIFLLYHPAVFIAAWFGRVGCGLLATILSVVVIHLLWLDSLSGAKTDGLGNLGLFFMIGIFQSLLIDLFQRALFAQKDANHRLAEARAELEKRVAERTAELVAANERLKSEIMERQQAQEQEKFYTQRSKALSLRLVELRETEHRRIARELHDEIGQNLTGLKVVLGLASAQVPPQVHEKFTEAQQLAQELLDRVRQLTIDLRPLMLDDLGLVATLKWFFDRFTRQTDIRVDFKHSPFADRLPPEIETTSYRIVQEALANVARHSQARAVTVRLWRDKELVRLQIEDDGFGFDVDQALASSASSGLSGMQERVALVGGELTLESSPGSGTRVTAELPISRAPVQR